MSTHHKHSAITRYRYSVRRAFTLVELVATMAVMTILMVGMGSAIMIATNALPDASSPLEISRASRTIADQITGDLLCVTAVTTMAPNTITFIVADRNHGDPGPETITYAWSGTPGDPLTRQYNGGTVATLIDNVHDFQLIYNVRVDAEQSIPTIENPETLLSSHDASVSLTDFAITDTSWIGQYFAAQLPVDAIEWRVTRVRFMARSHGLAKGITAVQLRPATPARLPDTTVLEELAMYESSLTDTYLWQEMSFDNVSGLSPSEGLCLVLGVQKTDKELADIQYDDGSGAARLTTSDGGSNWNYDSGKSMLYYVYGKATVPDPNPPPTPAWLRSVRVSLQAGDDPSTGHQWEIQTLNTPEVTGL